MQVAEWKFDQLDSDRDGVLKKKELKAFRGNIKKVLRPRRCGSSFTRSPLFRCTILHIHVLHSFESHFTS